MQHLHRLTTQYDTNEDRIRIVGKLASGEVMVLWLTQRLLVRLLPPVFSWLEKPHKHSISHDAIQNFAFESATANLGPEEPVEPLLDTKQWLVISIDLTPTDTNCLLCFKGADTQTASLSLDPQQMRQWLHILTSLWTAAGWLKPSWPEWLNNTEDTRSTDVNFH